MYSRSGFIPICLALFVITDVINAATYIGMLDELPDAPGQCYEREDPTNSSLYHPIGSKWRVRSGHCIEESCDRSDEKGKLKIFGSGCGAIGYKPPCKLVSDLAKGYPDCCPELVCPPSEKEAILKS